VAVGFNLSLLDTVIKSYTCLYLIKGSHPSC